MNFILPQLITRDIIVKCVSSLSTSILSSYNLYNIIINNRLSSHSDYQIYQNQIISTDLANKLLIASSLIKDIIKKNHSTTESNISIEKIIELYKDELKIDTSEEEDFDIITHIQNNNILSNVPEPIIISLNSTIEIIDKINHTLNKIHNKIKIYSASYFKYVSKLNLSYETDELINLDKIFDKRLGLLLEVLKIYSNVIKY
jgi:hypothetical protein